MSSGAVSVAAASRWTLCSALPVSSRQARPEDQLSPSLSLPPPSTASLGDRRDCMDVVLDVFFLGTPTVLHGTF